MKSLGSDGPSPARRIAITGNVIAATISPQIAPRRLPVFQEPLYPAWSGAAQRCGPAALALTPGERKRVVALAATSAAPNREWGRVEGLGSMGASLRAGLTLTTREASAVAGAAPLEYRFSNPGAGPVEIKLVALPVHALSSASRLRIGISVDGGPLEELDFATHGRSEEWKRNVLSNSAVKTRAYARLEAGAHVLRVYALDPGFILDRIDVAFDGAPRYYGAPP